MSRAWQPSLPLKRKDLDVFGDSPLSLMGWKKIKTLKCLPDSWACVLPAQASRQLYISSIFETICGSSDHWHFYFYLSDRKGLSLIQTVLLKRLELPPRPAGRMVTSETEGELGDLWSTELVQVPGVSLRLSWSLSVSSTKALPLSSKTFRSLWLPQSVYLLPKCSSGHQPLSTEIWTASFWKALVLLLPK